MQMRRPLAGAECGALICSAPASDTFKGPGSDAQSNRPWMSDRVTRCRCVLSSPLRFAVAFGTSKKKAPHETLVPEVREALNTLII